MSATAPHVVVLRRAGEGAAPWEDALAGTDRLDLDPATLSGAPGALARTDCVVVDGSAPDALDRLRRAHRSDRAVQALVVTPASERPRVERAILFTPGLGEVWLVQPEQLGPALLERAAGVTRGRRSYRATHGRIQQGVAALDPPAARRAVVSDAYLAALLDAAPDPILSIDEHGIVLSWNPGAERVLGYTRADAIGRPLDAVLAPLSGQPLARTSTHATRPTQREIEFRRKNGDLGFGQVILVPVEAAGHRVWAVIVRDLTEQRRAQQELEAQACELEAQAALLQEQAAELEAANEEMQERSRELEDALSARARFYAAMSHELRTPINAILGYQDLILAGIQGPVPDAQRAGLERAQRAARHLVELVSDVLDLAKIEAGRVDLHMEAVHFPELIQELLDTVRSLADQHGSRLELEGVGEHSIRSDPRRLRQILLNLLSNAIKFGEGKPVEARWCAIPGGGVRIEVVDHGRGIAPEDQGRVFEEFTQLDPSSGGTGLGLPISSRLTQLLGGTLEVSSAPGRGSTFRVTLPPSTPEDA